MSLNDDLKTILSKFRNNSNEDDAVEQIKTLFSGRLSYAEVDHNREERCGFPEVIYGEGKSAEQIEGIAKEILKHSKRILITRVDSEKAEAVLNGMPDLTYSANSRCLYKLDNDLKIDKTVITICAGTSDLSVAEEAQITASMFGCRSELISDVGVAGIHRIISKLEIIQEADCIIVAAGMEGALPSVVGGLVKVPVIAVPTSVGYGASFNGLAAMLGMLNSCASGLTVVNIDNGFGAGFAAGRIVSGMMK